MTIYNNIPKRIFNYISDSNEEHQRKYPISFNINNILEHENFYKNTKFIHYFKSFKNTNNTNNIPLIKLFNDLQKKVINSNVNLNNTNEKFINWMSKIYFY